MAKNQKITKNELFVLVKWIEDKKKLYSVISRKDVIEPVHKELEVNAIYNAKYGKEEFKAELLLTGTKSECENVLQMLIRKSIKKTSNNKSSSEKCKNSNSDSSNNVTKKQVETESSTAIVSYLEQLEERNKLVSDLNRKIEENEMKIQSLTEQLHVYSSINDHEFVKKIVSFSVQVLKHIGTPADREEVKMFSLNSGKLVLSNNYKTVLVDECFLMRIQILIDQKKSSKVIFKSMVSALIPDVLIWGKNNFAFMRENFSEIINACKDYINSKRIFFSDSLLKLCLRELCHQSKTRIDKSDCIEDDKSSNE